MRKESPFSMFARSALACLLAADCFAAEMLEHVGNLRGDINHGGSRELPDLAEFSALGARAVH